MRIAKNIDWFCSRACVSVCVCVRVFLRLQPARALNSTAMEEAWAEMKRNISLANRVNKSKEEVASFHAELKDALHSAVTRCRLERKRKRAEAFKPDLSDESVVHAARFTDDLPLADYTGILHLAPRLVNVVTVRSCTQGPLAHTRRQDAIL